MDKTFHNIKYFLNFKINVGTFFPSAIYVDDTVCVCESDHQEHCHKKTLI